MKRSLLLGSLLACLLLSSILARPAETAVPLAPQNNGSFFDTGQSLGGLTTYSVALGNLNGDNDLDAFAANDGANRVWINGGSAIFSGGQSLGGQPSNGVALGDLDGDLDLDAFVVNNGTNEVWLNNGAAVFSNSGQSLGSAAVNSMAVALGDLDGDGDLDAFVANDGSNEVWFNGALGQPKGTFTATVTLTGTLTSRAVSLGDVDGDKDLDAIVANGNTSSQPSKIWLNQGGIQGGTPGSFNDSGQNLDLSWNYDVALGDLDGDGDLDAFLTSWTQADTVWINQGGVQAGTAGQFSNSGQTLSGSGSTGIDLADLDGDGDLDAVVGRWFPDGNEVWFNQGGDQGGQQGIFVNGGQALDGSATYGIALGDLDGDNDADVVFGNFGANTVWVNGQPGVPNALFGVDARKNDTGRWSYPWTQPGDASLPVSLTSPAPQSLSVYARIDTGSGIVTRTLPFSAGEVTNPLTVQNPSPSPSHTFTITLNLNLTAYVREQLSQTNPGRINLVFVDATQGDQFCWLCFTDWLLRLMGFDTSFWELHHVSLPVLRGSSSWTYYTVLFDQYNVELTAILATHPSILWETFDVLETWTPAVLAIDRGEGSLYPVTQAMVDDAVNLLDRIKAQAGPELASRLTFEMNALDMASFVGLTMDQAAVKMQNRIRGQVYFPAVFSGN